MTAKKRMTPPNVPAIGPYPLDTIQPLDCVEGMKALPAGGVDVAIADPPYNASKGGVWQWKNSAPLPGFGGDWSKVMARWDNLPLADYLAFTLAWLAEVRRIVRPAGSLWIHGTYHNIGLINFALQILEIEIINEVIWFKRNSFPNLSGRRLTASHETILWAHTGGKCREYAFHYQAAKEMACPEDSFKEPGKQMRTVWDIPNNKDRSELRYGKHPTQKPLRLLKRMLALSATAGHVLLAPFAGAGSECVAAAEMGLHFLGFETEAEYVEIALRGSARRVLNRSSLRKKTGLRGILDPWNACPAFLRSSSGPGASGPRRRPLCGRCRNISVTSNRFWAAGAVVPRRPARFCRR